MEQERRARSEREAERNSEWSILLADREPTQRLIMARLLKRAGYQVATAADGKTALDLIHDGEFSILLTDWELPQLSGIELCRKIRRQIRHRYIYTIMLTARDSIEHVVHGLQSGADDYLTKPVIEPELIARLNTGKRIVSLEKRLRAANSDLQNMLICDALTVAYNRRYLIEQLPRDLALAAERGEPLSVIMCDVDFFKRINDTYGHPAGDKVLVEVSKFLKSRVDQAGGWTARYGGEEFTLVLPFVALSTAAEFAESLRRDLSCQAISLGETSVSVTASFGIAGWEQLVPDAADADELVALADEAVYESKQGGRNRVSVKELSYFAPLKKKADNASSGA